MSSRTTIAALLEDDPTLAGWVVYAEPPEQLGGSKSLVVAPRSPYQSLETFTRVSWHLSLTLLVPRTTPAPMDLIDAGLAILRPILQDIGDVELSGETAVGIIDDVGGVSYIAAAVNITAH